MSFFFSPDCNGKLLNSVFSFFILAKRLKEALAGFKNRNGRKTVVKSWISSKTLKIKERQKIF
jgi:hypothetical protein